MEIVVKIPDDMIKSLEQGNFGAKYNIYDLVGCLMHGTSLPKGHGKLIDYSWVVDNVIKKLGIKDERYLLEAEKALMSIIEIAPTIIEADKEVNVDE